MTELTSAPEKSPNDEHSALFKPPSIAWTTFGLCLATFMQVLDLTIANVSLPTIAGNLNVSTSQSTWVITSFAVSNAITLPLTGFLSKRYGESRLFSLCTLLFVITSFLCGIASSMSELVIYRALQGAVAGPLYPLSQSLLVAIYPTYKRGVAFAILGMVTVVAPIAGPILGGWLTSDYSWPWIFFINIPIGILSCAIVFFQFREMPKALVKTGVDFMGLILLIVAVGSLQIMLDLGNDDDWFNSNFILTCGLVALVGGITFLIWELTDKNPIVNLTYFKNRNFAIGTSCLVLGYAAFVAIGLIIPMWLQKVMNYDSMWAGLISSPIGILPILLAPIMGKYANRIDMRVLVTIAFLAMGLTCYWRSGFNTDVDPIYIGLSQFALGLGIAFFFMPLLTILLSDIEAKDVSGAAGLQAFLRVLGSSFSTSLSIFMWDHRGIIQHANLNDNISIYNPNLQEVLHTLNTNTEFSLAYLNRLVDQQAAQIAFNEFFYALTWIFFSLLFLVWFSRPIRNGKVVSK